MIFGVADYEGSRLKAYDQTTTFGELTSPSWRLKFWPLGRPSLALQAWIVLRNHQVAISNGRARSNCWPVTKGAKLCGNCSGISI